MIRDNEIVIKRVKHASEMKADLMTSIMLKMNCGCK